MALNLKNKKPNMVREIKEMVEVLYDKNWLKKTEDFDAYRVWRGVKEKGELRYDITIIPPDPIIAPILVRDS